MKIKNQQGFAHIAMIGLIVAVLAAIGGGGYYVWHKNHTKAQPPATHNNSSQTNATNQQVSSVINYDECTKAAGSTQLETYPPTCKTKNGQSFTQSTANSSSSTPYSELPLDLQAAIVDFTKSTAPACVKDGQPVDTNGNPTNPKVAYDASGSAIVPIGCDSPSATLFVQQGSTWKEIASTQSAFSCTLLKQYKIPVQLLTLSQGSDKAQCANGTNLETYSL